MRIVKADNTNTIMKNMIIINNTPKMYIIFFFITIPPRFYYIKTDAHYFYKQIYCFPSCSAKSL